MIIMTHLRGGCRDSAVNQPVVLAKGHAGLEPGVKMRMIITLLLLMLLLLLLTTPCARTAHQRTPAQAPPSPPCGRAHA